MGKYYRDQGDLDEALAVYRQSAAAAPGLARFHQTLGSINLARLGNQPLTPGAQGEILDQAESSFREALRLDPSLTTVKDNLARILVRKGEFQEADLVFNAALRQGVTDSETRLAFARMLVDWTGSNVAQGLHVPEEGLEELAAEIQTLLADPDLETERRALLVRLKKLKAGKSAASGSPVPGD